MHTPALLKEAIDALGVKKGGRYIDATWGEGGYSREILARGGQVLSIDWDEEQTNKLKTEVSNLVLVHGNFADIEEIAQKNGFYPASGAIFDLGLSMEQLQGSGRGFSYKRKEEPLDMRIDPTSLEVTAADLVTQKSLEELYDILAKNSEEIKSKAIAEEIKRWNHMETVGDLTDAIDRAAGFKSQSVYARIFQSLRMEVNHEIDNLKKGLEGASRIVEKGGRIVVVSFHSIEDRVVKNFGKRHRLKDKKPYAKRRGRSFEKSAKIRTIVV